MWAWAISTVGQAVATWLSAILSFAAILLALAVALVEQRRANRDRGADARRERAKTAEYIDAVRETIVGARDEISNVGERLGAGEQWSGLSGVLAGQLGARIEVLTVLRSMSPLNAPLALSLTRTIRALARAEHMAQVGMSVRQQDVIDALQSYTPSIEDEILKIDRMAADNDNIDHESCPKS